MKQVKLFLSEHATVIALSICILGLLLYAVGLNQQLNRYRQPRIVGTYLNGTAEMGNAEYVVFTQDGLFFRYRQFQMLETGTYETSGEGIFAVEQGAQTEFAVLRGEEVCCGGGTGGITVYTKMDDIPTFINVDAE